MWCHDETWRSTALRLSSGEYVTLSAHLLLYDDLMLEGRLSLKLTLLFLLLLKQRSLPELILGRKRTAGGTIALLPARLLLAIHDLIQAGPISMKQVVRENDLAQPRGVNLAKAPPLQPPGKALELGFTKEPGKDPRCELLLVDDAERSAGGEPRYGAATLPAAQERVELLGEVRFAAAARGSDGRVESTLLHGGAVGDLLISRCVVSRDRNDIGQRHGLWRD